MRAAARQNHQNDVCSAKTPFSLGIHPVWSVFACAQWVAKDLSFLQADSEDSDQFYTNFKTTI